MRTIIAKYSEGLRPTHNRDGQYTRAWRLWSDGVLERTNCKSKYQPYRVGERVPDTLVLAAKEHGITIAAARILVETT